MSRRRRLSGAPRKRHTKQESSLAKAFSQDDIELAQAVVQVVKDLVCQVANEPYGDLTRKRPSFFNVMRKFVKDSVQSFNDDIAAEYMQRHFKRSRYEPPEETPYGLELVWGIVLAEVEKVDKREKARVYSAMKAARQREQKRLDAIQAERTRWEERRQEAFEKERAQQALMMDGAMSMDSSPSSEEEELDKNKPLSRHINPFAFEADPPMMSANLSPSSRSDDSDWAEISRPTRTMQTRTIQAQDLHSFGTQLFLPLHQPIVDQPVPKSIVIQRGRGRGRGRGGRAPTVRSMIHAAQEGTAMAFLPTPQLHPHVSLQAPGLVRRLTPPQFDFPPSQKAQWEEKYIIKDPLPKIDPRMRGVRRTTSGRGRGGGGGGGGGPLPKNAGLIAAAWDADELEQHLLGETIESSGESASQESNHFSSTIDAVVKKVNEMKELDSGGKGNKRKMVEMKEDKKALNSNALSMQEDGPFSKRRKMCDVVTIDSESENDEEENPSLGNISPIRDSTIKEPLKLESKECSPIRFSSLKKPLTKESKESSPIRDSSRKEHIIPESMESSMDEDGLSDIVIIEA